MSKFYKIFWLCILFNNTAKCDLDAFLVKLAFWQLKGLVTFSPIEFLKDIFSVKKMDPYASKRAKIRNSSSLCPRENAFLAKRKLVVKQAVEKLLESDLSEDEIPNIALCFSGGGYRATIGTLSFLDTFEKEGLLPLVTYGSSLSGSTWAFSTWLGHDLTLNEVMQLTKSQISNSIVTGIDRRLLVENGIWKLFYGQKLSLVGIWGSIVANIFFNDFDRNYIGTPQTRILRGRMPKLSQFRSKIDDGNFPMPIFTAVSVANGYKWFEFNPYEVGLIDQDRYIPSWSFGRRFAKGKSIDYAPEHGIDYLMGIWGSAFTASLGEIMGFCLNKKFVMEVAGAKEKNILGDDYITAKFRSEFLNIRLSPAKVKSLDLGNENSFYTLVDAGIDFNLPVPPLLKKERKIDLIIICDLSSNAETATELKYAEEYAVKNGLKFPKINYEGIDKSIISIFKDPNPEVPIVIYMPMIKNVCYSRLFDPKEFVKQGRFCSTFNLQYTPQQFDELAGLIRYNLQSSIEEIKSTIKFVVQKKKKNSEVNNFVI